MSDDYQSKNRLAVFGLCLAAAMIGMVFVAFYRLVTTGH